jgi:lysophospholipase L1-like esterase
MYTNNSGQAFVVKSLKVSIHSRSGLGESAHDLCAVIIKTAEANTVSGLVSGVEQICFAGYKTQTSTDFEHTEYNLVFPGQGLYLPSGSFFLFNGQGITRPGTQALNFAADIKLKLGFAKADAASNVLPVQAIRTPYIDRRFTGNTSGLTPHTNNTNLSRPVLGAWTYMTTYAKSLVNCLGTKPANGTWNSLCSNYDASATLAPGPGALQYPGFAFNPGDQIAGQCTITSGDNSKGSICATYLYVAVPVQNGNFVPLERTETILTLDAQNFCTTSQYYLISDPGITTQNCLLMLIPSVDVRVQRDVELMKSHSTIPNLALATPKKVVFWGDSITQIAENYYDDLFPNAKVLNFGVSGDPVAYWNDANRTQTLSNGTTSNVSLNSLIAAKPDLIFIRIGINDMISHAQKNLVTQNYTAFVKKIRSSLPNATVVMVSILPVNWSVEKVHLPTVLDPALYSPVTNAEINTVNQNLQSIAAANGAYFLWDGYVVADSTKSTWPAYMKLLNSDDGVHPVHYGYIILKHAISYAFGAERTDLVTGFNKGETE